MTDPYIGEIRAFTFDFAPQGWLPCNGAVLQVQAFQALAAVLGSIYGGNGRDTFAVPDLRGRAPMHWGQGPGLTNRAIADATGAETVTLNPTELAAHTHTLFGASVGAAQAQKTGEPSAGAMFGQSNPGRAYAPDTGPLIPFAPNALAPFGQSQPHDNAQPRLVSQYCIAFDGVFPVPAD